MVLTGAEVDSIAGLLVLREQHAFALYASQATLAVLAGNPIFGVLRPALVPRRALTMEMPVELADAEGVPLGLRLRAFPVPGKPPLFAEGTKPDDPDQAIGLQVSAAGGPALFFIPGCAAMTPALREALRGAACVLFDGTLWRDDEMLRCGAGTKTGQRMGHMSISGPEGTLAAFADLGVRRRILIHLNNTNPVLLTDSPEHAAVRAAGWEVAEDGMEIRL